MKRLVPKRRFEEFKDADAWEQRKLGEVTECFSGGTPSVGNSQYYNGDIPFIRSGEISSNKTELFITEEGLNNSSAKVVKKGDILYALYGATSGEVSVSRINGAINQAILAIRSTRNDDHYLITQWLRIQKEQIISTYLQGGQGNLSGSIVKGLLIALPTDKEEQKLISLFLSNLDSLITLHQRKLDKLKSTKSAYLAEMFPKEGEVYPKRRFPGFIEPWEERKLGEIAKVTTGYPFRSSKFDNDGKYLVITNGNIQEDNLYIDNSIGNRIDIDNDLEKYILNCNDILITMDGTVGRVVKAIENNHILAQRVGRVITFGNREFIFQALRTERFYKEMSLLSTGGTIKHISLNQISDYILKTPSKEEQKKIGDFFSNLDSLITLQKSKLSKLQALKQSYLSEMFV